MGIVDIAEKETAKAKANKVELIELEIGTLAGIEFDSLDFVWSSAVKDTVLEHAIKKNKHNSRRSQMFRLRHNFQIGQHL